MLALPERNHNYRGGESTEMTFLGSFLLRAAVFALCAYAAWLFATTEIVQPEIKPGAEALKFLCSAFFVALASAVVVVGVVQYRHGTFTR